MTDQLKFPQQYDEELMSLNIDRNKTNIRNKPIQHSCNHNYLPNILLISILILLIIYLIYNIQQSNQHQNNLKINQSQQLLKSPLEQIKKKQTKMKSTLSYQKSIKQEKKIQNYDQQHKSQQQIKQILKQHKQQKEQVKQEKKMIAKNGPFTIGDIVIPQINQDYNLWTMPLQKKLKLMKQLKGKDYSSKAYTYPLSDKDEQTTQFMKQFENNSKVINWNEIILTSQINETILNHIEESKESLSLRKIKKHISQIKSQIQKNGNQTIMGNITYNQFLLGLQLIVNLLNFETNYQKGAYNQEYKYLNQKYHFNQQNYPELPICVIVPSYGNQKQNRYFKGIQALLIQKYDNYKVIIMVDGNQDKTAQLSANYLKYRNADPTKYILVHTKQRNKGLKNFYYAVHKYCDFNQIYIIADGDDQLIGRLAFKTVNHQYQKYKLYTLYSQYIAYGAPYYNKITGIGISEEYPEKIRNQNSYRHYKHSYSHLRSMMSDLMLLQRVTSLKTDDGDDFYAVLTDNAVMMPAFQMSCKRHLYLPELFYLYNANTGMNAYNYNATYYSLALNQIQNKKPYHCLEQILEQLQKNSTK